MSAANNPYVLGAEGRREWNDRYMNMAKAIRNWQLAFFAAILICVIFSIVIAKIALESKIKPYAVEVDHGMPYAITPMDGMTIDDQRIVNFALNQFILNARTVLTDSVAEKNLLDKVYAYSAGDTINFLHNFYNKNNPFAIASEDSVSVNIVNAMPISKNTWQITWDETKRSNNGNQIVSVQRWMANITYQFGDINTHFINDNPFGIYVTDVSWSQSETGGENNDQAN